MKGLCDFLTSNYSILDMKWSWANYFCKDLLPAANDASQTNHSRSDRDCMGWANIM